MSLGFASNRRAAAQQPSVQQDVPAYAAPNAGGGHGFLIFSALIHIAAVVALMHSWSGGIQRAKAETATASSAAQPTAARLSIDIAPVQYCDMDIEKIVSRPHGASAR